MTEDLEENFCLNCFADQGSASTCPYCGYRGDTRRPSRALPSGSLLQGRYLTGRTLEKASNEFNLAYRALDTRSCVPVVVREYFPRELARRLEGTAVTGPGSMRDAPSYSFGLKAFLGEARELCSLFHPHVVSTRHIFEENGTAYVVEDYCEAQTLGTYLNQTAGPLPQTKALQLVTPVLDAIEAAHNKGLLHLDLGLENILIKDAEDPVIVGFAASRIAFAERTISLPGLPNSCFTPMERYLSVREMGPWTDVYSVAAILYRVLTGIDPPEAAERCEVDTLIPTADCVPDGSPQVSAAIAFAMQVNRKDRPQSIAEFRRSLLPESIGQHDVGLAPRLPPWDGSGRTLLARVAKTGFAVGGLAYLTILGYVALISLTKPQAGPDAPSPLPSPLNQPAATLDETVQVPQAPNTPPPAPHPPDAPSPPPVAGAAPDAAVTAPDDFQALVSRAKSGTPQDGLRLARAYEYGEGTAKSIKKALKWYRLSAKQNLAEAQAALGRIYVTGASGRRNRAAAVKWYRRAADQGLPDAQFALATLYELGLGVRQNRSEALKLYRLAADNGQAMAQNRLGKIYDEGQGVIADDQIALDWYRRAAEQGDANAQLNLALMYKNGEGTAKDREEALRWLESAAAAGNGSAKTLLKKMLANH